MSTNATITYNDISSLKSKVEILNSTITNGVAVYQAPGSSTSVKPISALSFILLEIPVTFPANATSADIKVPVNANAGWIKTLSSQNFVVLSDVKQDSADEGGYRATLFTNIKSGTDLASAGTTIGKIVRGSADKSSSHQVTVDILFISLNP